MKPIDAVLGQPWAIEPEWLRMIAAIAERQFDSPVVAAMQTNPPRVDPMPDTGNVAVINILGPVFPRANMMTQNSGATSLSKLQAQFRTALADPQISAILFNIDSPGGVTTGIADFADEIRAARSQKPIASYVGGLGASAAYWIATATSSITMASTAWVGSIGVAAGMSKQVAPDEKGMIQIDIVSSNAPNKRPDATDSAGRAAIMAQLDALEAVFVGFVAANRGVSTDTVKSDFGKGGVLMGAAAVAAGMADRVGTIDSVVTKLAAASSVNRVTPRAAAAAVSETPMVNFASVAELTAAYPELVGEIRRTAQAEITTTISDADIAEHRVEGAAAERARIVGINALTRPGFGKLIAECIADGNCSPGDAALRLIGAENEQLGRQAQAIADVEKVTGNVAAAPASSAASVGTTAAAGTPDGWKADWARNEALQNDFPTADRYASYMQGVKDGRIRVLKTAQAG